MEVSNVGRHRGTVTVAAENDATGPFKLYVLRRHFPESHHFKLSVVDGTQPCSVTGTINVQALAARHCPALLCSTLILGNSSYISCMS